VAATVKELRSEGLEVSGVACHVGSDEQRRALIAAAVAKYGPRIDVLVSNAAVNPTAGPLLDTPLDAADKILDINVKAALALVSAAAPHLQRGSSVVIVSSVTAYAPPFPIGFYAVSKTALLGLVKGLAGEMGPSGVRVNGVVRFFGAFLFVERC
jgi:dehydrogenase/reductase SDR family protein 4